jgi:hypothetical protein
VLELDGVVALFVFALWVYCFIDVLLTPDGEQRNLPKLAWVFIVLLFADIGSIAWLVAGKNWNRTGAGAAGRPAASATRRPEYDRPGRHVPTNPDDDEVFLAGLRQRAEEQRKRAREQNVQEPGEEPTA